MPHPMFKCYFFLIELDACVYYFIEFRCFAKFVYSILLWGLQKVVQPPADSVSSLSFSPKANFLVAGSWDNQVHLF